MDQLPRNESAPFKLPEVQSEPKENAQQFESASKNVDEHSMARAIEKNATTNPLNNAAAATMPISVTPIPISDPPSVAQTGKPSKITVTDGLAANDTDLIEKAWVVKAKAIVAQTKDDPFEQSNEIKKIRNDYLSKRFNTNLKIDNE